MISPVCMNRKKFTPVVLALVLLLAVQSQAQEATDEEQEEAPVLEEIMVTALKTGRATRRMDTPLAISALGGEDIEGQNVENLKEVIGQVGGLSITNIGEQLNIIQIRGVSSLIGDSSVGFYLDDLSFSQIGQNLTPEINPFDLDRIEVLKGPQGTLYGASASGGVVRVLTKEPVMNEMQFKFDGGISYTEDASENYRGNVAVNVPLVEDKMAARLVVGARDSSGFYSNPLAGEDEINDSETVNARLRVLFTPTDRLTLKGSVWYYDIEVGSQIGADDDYNRPIDPSIPHEDQKVDYIVANGVVEYDFGNALFYSATSYMDMDNHQTFAVFPLPLPTLFHAIQPYESINNETRISSNFDSPFQLTLGFYYNHAEMPTTSLQETFAPPSLGSVGDDKNETEQWAVFGQVQYAFSERWEATVGLRYFEDERNIESRDPAQSFLLGLLGVSSTRDADFNDVSPRFNLAYSFEDGGIAYATVAKGFRSGILNGTTNVAFPTLAGLMVPSEVKEETIWNYELGLKQEWMDGDFLLDIAGYYSEVDELQFNIVDFGVIPGAGLQVLSWFNNAGKAEVYGVDWGLIYRGIEGLSLTVSGNWNSAEYEADNAPVASGPGDRLQFSPEWTLAFSADYTRPLPAMNANLVAGVNLQHVSERYEYTIGTEFVSDEITSVDARIGIDFDNWGITFNVANLFDEDDAVTVLTNSPHLPQRLRPRTYGINLHFDY